MGTRRATSHLDAVRGEILDEVADSINDQMVDDLRREEVAS